MRVPQIGTPISSSNWQHAEFGYDDGGTDGCSDFFGGLDPETNMAFRVANNDDGLETCALTGAGLLLDGFNLSTHQVLSMCFPSSTSYHRSSKRCIEGVCATYNQN